MPKNTMLLEVLFDNGTITEEQKEKAKNFEALNYNSLREYLVEEKMIDEEGLLFIYQEYFGVKIVGSFVEKKEILNIDNISRLYLQENKIIPYRDYNGDCSLLMLNPLDRSCLETITLKTGINFIATSSKKESIEDLIKYIKSEKDNSYMMSVAFDITELLKEILIEAIEERTSDIHLELKKHNLVVRFRIDGFLKETRVIAREYGQALISKVKLVSGLNITEKRIPQDGRFSFKFKNRSINLRISTIPTYFGEKVVLRILQTNSFLTSKKLGFSEESLTSIRNIIKQKGLIIVSGLVGEGKSTTVNYILQNLDLKSQNIISIEDPIEYIIPEINQIQINKKANIEFKKVLKSIVRQDPDAISLGEVRDSETAKAAIKLATTGHLTFSTIHSSNSKSVVDRLLNMGVERFLIDASLSGIINQRLIRKNCTFCLEKDKYLDFSEIKFLRKNKINESCLRKSTGCISCQNTGFYGRIALFNIENYRQKRLELTFQEDALKKLRKGIISLEEMFRVLGYGDGLA